MSLNQSHALGLAVTGSGFAARAGFALAFAFFLFNLALRFAQLFVQFVWRALRKAMGFFTRAFAVVLAIACVGYFSFNTPSDVPYRAIDPLSPVCDRHASSGWSILAESGNDEMRAIEEDPVGGWENKLQCALQRHEIPYRLASAGPAREDAPPQRDPLRYTLSFVEFNEAGGSFDLIKASGQPYSAAELNRKVVLKPDSSSRPGARPRFTEQEPITQLRALTQHLNAVKDGRETHRNGNGKVNYVIVFIHGWRHNASVGDGNVSDLRVYAAHAARFLRERCDQGEKDQCDREVTAVYIGWRGARVDEPAIRRPFEQLGNWLDAKFVCGGETAEKPCTPYWSGFLPDWGAGIANVAAALTLFDRKPVSEDLAPRVRMALRSIEASLGNPGDTTRPESDKHNRLIVFGHSLGGNMLATALKDDLLKRVGRHQGGQYFDPPIGNLTVLINPAAEASKWTDIQRPIFEKMVFRKIDGTDKEIDDSMGYFAPHQRPAVVSVTAAFAWPSGGVRAEDCAFSAAEEAEAARAGKGEKWELSKTIKEANGKRADGVEYDWATHDLFPLFRFDFRPAADLLEGLAERRANNNSLAEYCGGKSRVDSADGPLSARVLHQLAETLRQFPFQNTDIEQTRTIGHVDPPRSPVGTLYDDILSARPYGTTHEIRSSGQRENRLPESEEAIVEYDQIPHAAAAECPISHDWLTRARRAKRNPPGAQWDSDMLAGPIAPDTAAPRPSGKHLRARITHGYMLSGINPITRANDPFWNIRASDDVLAQHDGYLVSAFICAMNQLVMDEPTRPPAPVVPAPVQIKPEE